ncbi:hypothetical protein PWT90_09147 [Aphanocladium album]|nr:hypothetical protein PWT90_09147 [Aphanocladium album]
MPRGGYDCTGAAPGSFASREGRQMYACGGGNTPRASQAAMLPGTIQYQQPMMASSTTPRASQMFAVPPHGQAMGMSYGFHGTGASQAGFVPQQQSGAYLSGSGFAPAQPQMQTFTHYGYSPSTIQVPVGTAAAGGVANTGMMFAGAAQGGYPAPLQQQQQQQQQHVSIYGGFTPAQAPFYRH